MLDVDLNKLFWFALTSAFLYEYKDSNVSNKGLYSQLSNALISDTTKISTLKIIFIRFLDKLSVFTFLIGQVDYQEDDVLFTSYGDDGMNINIFLIFPTNNILKLLTHDIILWFICTLHSHASWSMW